MRKRGFHRRARASSVLAAGASLSLVLLVGLLGLWARRAAASDLPLTLGWQGPEECQAAPRVLGEVRRLLGSEPPGAGLTAHVKVGRVGKRWRLALTTTDASGRLAVRQIDAESCAAAADAAAVILALAIDPSRALGGDSDRDAAPGSAAPSLDASSGGDARAQEPPPARTGPATQERPAPDPARDAEDAGSEPPPFPLFLAAIAASDTGTLPSTGFGVRGGLGLDLGLLRLEGLVGYWPTVDADLGGFPARGGAFTLLTADLRACLLFDTGVVAVGPCAGGGLARVHAEAFGVTIPIATATTWGTLLADGLVRVRLSRHFSLRLSAGLSVPLIRPVFAVEDLGPVYQPSAVALQIGAGMEVHF